ncbi:uncharacterized protein LOC135112719 [Scylla paramamosain]|uniref:uncharacterized protein LOC135112719 n=1 Tax=Scylla paramamosain TaxID=85552 RepID=UPI003082AA08
MGGVGGAKKGMGTQRPMGVTVLVVVAATVMLMSAPAGQALSLHDHICRLSRRSIEIYPFDTVYLGTNALSVLVTMESAGCVNSTKWLFCQDFKASNETTISLLSFKWNWYELTFISCGKYIAKIGSKIVKFKRVVPPHCLSKSTTLRVDSTVVLGRKCTGPERKVRQSKAECKRLEQEGGVQGNLSNLDTFVNYFEKELSDPSKPISRRPFSDDVPDPAEPAGNTFHKQRTFSMPKFSGNKDDPKESEANNSKTVFHDPLVINSETFLKGPEVDDNKAFINWPKDNDILQANFVTPPTYIPDDDFFLNDPPGYTVHRKYKENAIPIFIGIVALTVSMCLRFCLCRGKSVVRRVTTVTVIRSRPVGSPDAPQDQQDPPPSYVDVVNEVTTPESPSDEGSAEPPPPAYADIVDEVQPPTYSEVEAQSMPASEMLPLAEQEAGAQNTQPPPDSESVPDAKGLAATRSMLSKYRHQQKQFAFKVLEED